jgi:hypothetical protein
MSRRIGASGVLVVLAILLSSVGCTGSDALKSGNGRVQVLIEPTPNNTQFGDWTFQIRAIQVRPTNPQASTALGTDNLGLVSNAVTIDLNFPFDQTAETALAAGTYRVESMVIQGLLMFASNLPATPQVCEDFIVGQLLNTPLGGNGSTVSSFGGLGAFTVDDETGGQLRIQLDSDAFRDAIYASIGCGNCQPAGCDTQVPFDPNCVCTQVGNFNAVTFRGLSDTYFIVN